MFATRALKLSTRRVVATQLSRRTPQQSLCAPFQSTRHYAAKKTIKKTISVILAGFFFDLICVHLYFVFFPLYY
jgi:hypothetical protein